MLRFTTLALVLAPAWAALVRQDGLGIESAESSNASALPQVPLTLATMSVTGIIDRLTHDRAGALPSLNEECTGTWYHPRLRTVCGTIDVPILTASGAIQLRKVTLRCFKTDTGFSLTWRDWFDDGDEPVDSEKLSGAYARPSWPDLYATEGELGVCKIPRAHHCTHDADCRPGTLCLRWRGTRRDYRCGNFGDNDDVILSKEDVIPRELKEFAEDYRHWQQTAGDPDRMPSFERADVDNDRGTEWLDASIGEDGD